MRLGRTVWRGGTALLTSTLVATLLVLAGAGQSAAPQSPETTAASGSSYLCTGYTGCRNAGYSDAGYGAVNSRMYWRMYSGHNCTNYAAYRMIKAGMSNDRPWDGSGMAYNWGYAMARITNTRPSVGAVAWWDRYDGGIGSSGHVAYVERVVSADEIVISEDSWSGDFHWRTITRDSGRWPTGFIHFVDKTVQNTAAPTITGHAAGRGRAHRVARHLVARTRHRRHPAVVRRRHQDRRRHGPCLHAHRSPEGAPAHGRDDCDPIGLHAVDRHDRCRPHRSPAASSPSSRRRPSPATRRSTRS